MPPAPCVWAFLGLQADVGQQKHRQAWGEKRPRRRAWVARLALPPAPCIWALLGLQEDVGQREQLRAVGVAEAGGPQRRAWEARLTLPPALVAGWALLALLNGCRAVKPRQAEGG